MIFFIIFCPIYMETHTHTNILIVQNEAYEILYFIIFSIQMRNII